MFRAFSVLSSLLLTATSTVLPRSTSLTPSVYDVACDVSTITQSVLFHTASASMSTCPEALSTAEFLDTSLAFPPSTFELVHGMLSAEKLLSVSCYPGFDVKLCKMTVDLLKKCGSIAGTTANRVHEIREHFLGASLIRRSSVPGSGDVR